MKIDKVAIIGAGLAGLACARTLAAHGVAVRLFDKGRGPGGRMATRRVEVGGHAFSFDHGAQYLTTRTRIFGAMLDTVGAKPWPQPGRFVGVPRMSQIPRALADGLDVTLYRHVTALDGGPGQWRLQHFDAARIRPGRPLPEEAPAEDGPFDAVVLALPAPQAVPLLQPAAPLLAELLGKVVLAPCWTLMAALPERLNLPDWQQLEGGPISWLARDSSKPGRDAAHECWVAQASPEWSRAQLEKSAEAVAALLLEALGKLAGTALPTPIFAAAHRWRFGLAESPFGAPCLWDATLGLGAAGDWCLGKRAEDAVESGMAMAAAIRKA
jgi:predicted NAD/FAD-dependent oxidoreductase